MARTERGVHYFCSHPIGHNSATGFHLTRWNAEKCSLPVCLGRKENRVEQTPTIVPATRTLNSEIKYTMGQSSENRLVVLHKPNN